MLVFGEIKKEVCCNLVRLKNLYRFQLVSLLDVLFPGEVKKMIWWFLVMLNK